MRHAGTVMAMAADDLIEEARRRTTRCLDVPEDRVSFSGGRFVVDGTNHSLDLFELARRPAERDGPFRSSADTAQHTPVAPTRAATIAVEADPHNRWEHGRTDWRGTVVEY